MIHILISTLALLCSIHPEQQDTSRTVTLDEATVFSQPKEYGSLRQQPTSVSTLDATTLQQHNIASIKQVGAMIPNFFMPDYGSRQTSAIYLRGIGSRINTPAVGMYVDNFCCFDKSAFDSPLYDIERIEILRGPQSTMYGRGTMGGLIRIHTRSPFDHQGTDIRMGVSSANWGRNVAITHYHRVNDRLAFSGGGYYTGQQGYFKNDLTDKLTDSENAGGGRLRLLYRGANGFRLDTHISYDYTRGGAYPYYYKGNVNPAHEEHPEYIGLVTANREGYYRRSMLSAGINAELRRDTWTLNAVTSLQHINDRMLMDQDFLPADIYTLEQRQNITSINEEVTLKQSPARWWQGVSGLTASYQANHTQAPVTFCPDGVAWLNSLNSYSRITDQEVCFRPDFQVPTMNLAAFHQSTFRAGQFSATLGLRADLERHWFRCTTDYTLTHIPSYRGITMPTSVITRRLPSRQHCNQWQILPRLALRYDLPVGNVYASVSRGFRSGGYNIQNVSEIMQDQLRHDMIMDVMEIMPTQPWYASIPQPAKNAMNKAMLAAAGDGAGDIAEACRYKPEYAWNYEVGTHLTLWEKRLTVDASAFWSNIHDLQLSQMVTTGLGRITINAGRSRSIGAEAAVTLCPVKGLQLSAHYGYTLATFRDYQISDTENLRGHYVPFIPKHTFNMDACYRLTLSDNRFVVMGADLSGVGRIYWTERNNASQPLYLLLGARLGYILPHVEFYLWGKNLTNTDYDAFYFESRRDNNAFGQSGRPAQAGIDVRIKF